MAVNYSTCDPSVLTSLAQAPNLEARNVVSVFKSRTTQTVFMLLYNMQICICGPLRPIERENRKDMIQNCVPKKKKKTDQQVKEETVLTTNKEVGEPTEKLTEMNLLCHSVPPGQWYRLTPNHNLPTLCRRGMACKTIISHPMSKQGHNTGGNSGSTQLLNTTCRVKHSNRFSRCCFF